MENQNEKQPPMPEIADHYEQLALFVIEAIENYRDGLEQDTSGDPVEHFPEGFVW